MKPQVGDVVRVEFWDHAENAEDAMYFKVYGEITKETKVAYKILSWGYVRDTDRAVDDNPHNEHYHVIVKKAIEVIDVL